MQRSVRAVSQAFTYHIHQAQIRFQPSQQWLLCVSQLILLQTR